MSSDSEVEVIEKKYRKQKFNAKWLEDKCFVGWLESSNESQYKCKCIACGKTLNCGKSELLKHADTKIHKANVLAKKNTKPVAAFFERKGISSVEKSAQAFEIRISLFFAEHNVALHIVDHLIPLLKKIVPDSEIIKKAELGRAKCTGIIKNVIAKEQKELLIKKLQSKQFSIMIDESTDIGLNKTMCVLVRFYDQEHERVVVKLLDLLPIKIDCTAEALFNTFKNCIIGHKIPFSNIIGMCSDGASVMVGQHNSFASRLIESLPNVVVVKCICHSSAIIASKACLALPRAPEELLRQIGSYTSGSSKRCAQLAEIQDKLNEKKRKILRTSSTRWLSHQKCVESVLLNWNVLHEFFKDAAKQDKLKSAELILSELTNECNKAYLLFLKYVLNYFNTLNALFQSKKTLIHVLHSESVKLFMMLGQNFIKKTELKTNCVVRNPHVLLKTEEVFLGNECNEFLKTLPKSAANQIRLDCFQFYIIALEEIQSRLPLKTDSIFKEVEFLNPCFVLGREGSKPEHPFTFICQKLKLDASAVLDEWRKFEYNFSESEKDRLVKLDVHEFWGTIGKMKNFSDEFCFPLLSEVAKFCLALPHANADSERIFSIITDVRTKKRNKLSHENLSSICIIRSFLQDENLNCITYNDQDSLFKHMVAVNLYDHH